jgi:hypothetical protein
VRTAAWTAVTWRDAAADCSLRTLALRRVHRDFILERAQRLSRVVFRTDGDHVAGATTAVSRKLRRQCQLLVTGGPGLDDVDDPVRGVPRRSVDGQVVAIGKG